MPTADASQFTEMKRYQSSINGSLGANPLKFRVPSSFGSYRPSYNIGFLPANAIISNKEIIAPPTDNTFSPPAGTYTVDMTSGTSSLVTISPSSDIVSLYLQNLYTPVTSITKIRLSFSGFNFYTGTTLLIDDIPNNNFTLDNGNPNIVDVNSAGGAPIVTSTSILTFTFPFIV